MISDWLKYVSGNATIWASIVMQHSFTGEDFRTWTSWAVGLTVGILTIRKLIKDTK